MKSGLFAVCLLVAASVSAQVNVTLKTDASFTAFDVKERIERSASAILSEINSAQQQSRVLDMRNLKVGQDAQDALGMMWATTHFLCDDEEVVERLWPMTGGTYLIRRIPLIITPPAGTDVFGTGTYQEAVMEFDGAGRLVDFRFALDGQLSESMENCGDVADQERHMQIRTYMERFRTAYNTKDLAFLEQVFSDDAIIITGRVTTTKESGFKVTYNEQDKRQYMRNLARTFRNNSWIEVKFSPIGENGEVGGCPGITRSKVNPNFYGVRVRQEWKSSRYSDEGYLFLLWDFTDELRPQIHVRTWQPEWVGDQKLPEKDIFDISIFEKDIQNNS